MDSEADKTDGSATLSATRAKRERNKNQTSRLSALERLKSLKGAKNKVDVTHVDNVYDVVDEKEYSKRVLRRQEDDWIDDDDGNGYVEDGREIFDDEDDINFTATKSKASAGKNKNIKSSSHTSGSSKSSNLKNMLVNMGSKPKASKEKDVNLNNDDILGDLMQELDAPTPNLSASRTFSVPAHPTSKSIKARNTPFPTRLPAATRSNLGATLVKRDQIASQPDEDLGDEISDQPVADFDVSLDDLEQATFDDVEDHVPEPQEREVASDLKEPLKKNQQKIECSVPVNSLEGHAAAGWNAAWSAMKSQVNTNEILPEIDSSDLVTSKEGEEIMRIFWLDAYEDPIAQPGVIYLFGKTYAQPLKQYVSCCVTIRNVERKIFVLPRKYKFDMAKKQSTDVPVQFMDVYTEFNEQVASKFKISLFRSRKVVKRYAFELPDVPAESDYLEVKYSASMPSLPRELQGETFSNVFGAQTSSLENFIIEKRIKGPCWLDVKCPKKPTAMVSWCKFEVSVDTPDHIIVPKDTSHVSAPPVVLMGMTVRTAIQKASQQSEVVAIGCLVHRAFPLDGVPPNPPFQEHFAITTCPSEETWPIDFRDKLLGSKTKMEKANSERELLNLFLLKLQKMDPDLIVGHDISSFDLEVLLHRILVHKVPNWSRLGRLRRTNASLGKNNRSLASHIAVCGRLMCDIKISARELIRARSYDLNTLCQQVFGSKQERPIWDSAAVKQAFKESGSLLRFIDWTMEETLDVLKLMCELNVIPLALQITQTAGNLLSRTLLGGRSERNEYLLLHAFNERDYIVPDKTYKKAVTKDAAGSDEDDDDSGKATKKAGKAGGRRKPAYSGGLVLDPKCGFYDNYILLMDFNSLYPSIIQEYNICFTTVNRTVTTNEGEETIPDLPGASLPPGVLPVEIRKLVESRRAVKSMMKNPDLSDDLKLQYDIRQKALKLTANSMYGCLGFQYSRFYAKPLAALITAKGRETLLQTRELVSRLNLDVVYGDTDSLMINSNCKELDQVFKLGNKIKGEVNKLYKYLELEIDGVFQRLLLLKKKKYAAVTVSKLPDGQLSFQQEVKGLDIVRRDWSQLAIDTGKFVLDQILTDMPPDDRIAKIHSHLEDVKTRLEEGRIAIPALAITKQLTKNPEDYSDSKSLAHVQVALRVNSKGGKKLRTGDTVSYIICQDGSNLAPSQRAYSVDDVRAAANAKTEEGQPVLKPDIKYYLGQQVFAVIDRLCEPLEGTDSSRLAKCLGLDVHTYAVKSAKDNGIDQEAGNVENDDERFKSCHPFSFTCPNPDCLTVISISVEAITQAMGSPSTVPTLQACSNKACSVAPYTYLPRLVNKLTNSVRSDVHKFYSAWLTCEDPACSARIRRMPLRLQSGLPHCLGCGKSLMYKEYSDADLYKQLCFYQRIFTKPPQSVDSPQLLQKAYSSLGHVSEKWLNRSAYAQVDLQDLFSGMYPADIALDVHVKEEPM